MGAITRLADEERPAAWVWVELEAAPPHGEAELRDAWERALEVFPRVHAARRALWRTVHLVVEGDRSNLERAALELLTRLTESGHRVWRVVLVEVLAPDAKSTLSCDPGYDLRELRGSAALWVRPYRGHHRGWFRRYPTVSVIAGG